ncbi:MAG: hypothetical protein ACI9OD_003290 [Limisphaerales bacterium]|jgi:hypothetical protein
MEKILDEIVRTSTRPLRYVVEDYGIVFEPGDRKLMVNPSTVPSATWVNTRKGPIARKLNEILISEIAYNSLTLDEAIADLLDISRRRDPTGEGVNIVFSQNADELLPNHLAHPLRSGSPGMDLNTVLVNIRLPLFNLKLRQVLDAVVRTADQPIKYTVTDYGIVFSSQAKEQTEATIAPAALRGAKAEQTHALLRKTVIREAAYDDLTLEKVLDDLRTSVRRANASAKHIEFKMIPAAPKKPDVSSTVIRINFPVHKLTVEQLLDLFIRTADQPIEYVIEDDAVIFRSKRDK